MTGPHRRRRVWALVGAVTFIVANAVWAWFRTGPDHYEWTDPALVMAPVVGALGGGLGYLAARLADRRGTKGPR